MTTRWPVTRHATRTAVAAITSLLVARLFKLPEAYWAPITTIVIEQSSLGAALGPSWQRFLGTMLGAALGAVAASQFSVPNVGVFGASVFVLGLLRVVTRIDLNGYRLGAVTLGIVLLVPRTGAASTIALHRFIEVSVGIAVALALAVVWPEEVPTNEHSQMHAPKPVMDLSDVMRIARQAASDEAVLHKVVGVSGSGRGSDYVEIVVTSHDPRGGSSVFVVGAFRNVSEASLRRDIISQLRQHGIDHR